MHSSRHNDRHCSESASMPSCRLSLRRYLKECAKIWLSQYFSQMHNLLLYIIICLSQMLDAIFITAILLFTNETPASSSVSAVCFEHVSALQYFGNRSSTSLTIWRRAVTYLETSVSPDYLAVGGAQDAERCASSRCL